MTTNLARYKSDLDKLVKLGLSMDLDMTLRHLKDKGQLDAEQKKQAKEINGTFEREYQKWYTRSEERRVGKECRL